MENEKADLEWVSYDWLAEKTGLTKSYIYNIISKNKIKTKKHGKDRINLVDFERWYME